MDLFRSKEVEERIAELRKQRMEMEENFRFKCQSEEHYMVCREEDLAVTEGDLAVTDSVLAFSHSVLWGYFCCQVGVFFFSAENDNWVRVGQHEAVKHASLT